MTEMKYCSHCGSQTHIAVPRGDNRERDICEQCGTIHYQNPKIVVGCIPEYEDKILLCRRAIEPRYGLWTLPAGFMENDETTEQAAIRETHEEACANVDIMELYGLFNIPHINQVYMLYRARLIDTDFGPGEESLDVELFGETNIPWDDIAFPVIRETLLRYFKERNKGTYSLQTADISPR
jgi:ADP-ribose pyrophosphatase YjhB (NUDIX family)